MDKQVIEHLQTTHLAVWKEKNREKRDQLMATIYAQQIKMYDKDFILQGTKEISEFIDKLQRDPEFDFKAAKPMEAVQNGLRLFWNIQTGQGLLKGMDFFILEEGKVLQLYAFME